MRGRSKHQLKNFNEEYFTKSAIEDFSKVIELDPYYKDAYFYKGLVRGSSDIQSAIEDFSKVIELDPYYKDAYLYRGHIKEASGNIRGAIKDYSKVIELDPSDEKAMAWRSRAEYKNMIMD